MRTICLILVLFALPDCSFAETLRTKLVLASYRLEHPKTAGTCFLMQRPDPADENSEQYLLVTAAHAFAAMNGKRPVLILRNQDEDGNWQAVPTEIVIREGNKPLWHQHPKEDVAVLAIQVPEGITANALPLKVLATKAEWNSQSPEPGSLVRCVGYPHASLFKPNETGFPNTRLGCISDYPLTPIEDHDRFLVDFNVFEGDSGGAVYSEEFESGPKIIGLVHGQHFLNEQYKLIYSEGRIRKRLGLAIVVNSVVIRETIEGMPDPEAP
jgi:hypothetical protein